MSNMEFDYKLIKTNLNLYLAILAVIFVPKENFLLHVVVYML